jgi:hypothetical protein
VLLKFDGLWERPFPYLMAWYQAPTDGAAHPETQLHAQFYPPYRTRDRLKYLAGTELAAGMFAMDVLPETRPTSCRQVECAGGERMRPDRRRRSGGQAGRAARCAGAQGAAAIRLRGTRLVRLGHGRRPSAVLLTADTGVAEVLVTREEAVVLTDEIEARRLRREEARSRGFTFHVAPWAETELRDSYVLGAAGRPVLSDRPHGRRAAAAAACASAAWC